MDGEDVVQEALFEAYRKLDKFDESRPLKPWLFRIAHNTLRMDHRPGRSRSRRVTSVGPAAEQAGARSQRIAEATSTQVSTLERVPLKFIRFKAVRERTGLSRSTIWRLDRAGAFPRHHQISANAVAWMEQDVVNWIQSKAGVR
jgi:predicted DNA-binding transcriptional regulator AlpA